MDNIFLATVLECMPDIGMAIVSRSLFIGRLSVPVVACLPYTDTHIGTSVYPMYPAGTQVLCFVRFVGTRYITYIISPVNINLDKENDNALQRMLDNVEELTQSDDRLQADVRMFENLLRDSNYVKWIKLQAHGVSPDALPGDHDILNKLNATGLHIGSLLSFLKGSAGSLLYTSALDGTTEVSGTGINLDTPLSEEVHENAYFVHNVAVTATEAFGAFDGTSPLKVNSQNERLEFIDDAALPFYRLQHAEGMPVFGKEDIVLSPPADGAKLHTPNTEPMVMSRIRQSLTGELSSVSAYGMMTVKTPYIPAVLQVGYGKEPVDKTNVDSSGKPLENIDDLRTPYTKPQELPEAWKEARDKTPPSEEDAVTDAALNKLIDTLMEGDYKEKLLEIMAKKGFSISNEEASLHGKFKEMEPKELRGATTAATYPLPNKITLTDAVTGEERTYYDSSSFISHEPDGSICICDGYGSEIRLSRGNIYISPALDLFLRPGRDLSAMVPRHLSLNAQETVTVNSSDAMYVRAASDLKIAGATSGIGKFTIEYNGMPMENKEGERQDGFSIHSEADISITAGYNMHLGINDFKSAADTEKTMGHSGAIVINAGKDGAMYLRSGVFTTDAQELTLAAATADDNPKGSVISVAGNLISLLSGGVFTTGAFVAKSKGKGDVTLLRDDEPVKVDLYKADTVNMEIGGGLIVNGNMIVNGAGKFCANNSGTGLITHGIASSQQLVVISSSPTTPGDPKTAPFYVEKQKPVDIPEKLGYPASYMVSELMDSLYSDSYILNNKFKFPDSYGVTMHTMPGMVWQDRARESSVQGALWKEDPVFDAEGDNPTACYPGWGVWESATVSAKGYNKDAKLNNSGYITNNPRQT